MDVVNEDLIRTRSLFYVGFILGGWHAKVLSSYVYGL